MAERLARVFTLCAILAATAPDASAQGLFRKHRAPADGPITMEEFARRLDELDEDLFEQGTIGVKSPDVSRPDDVPAVVEG